MTDKVQKIRQEVEKLKSNLIHGACASQVAMENRCKEEAYNEVLAILDSMQEEPVSEFSNTESMIESYKQMLISQPNGLRSPLIDMCLASYKHGINEILDTLNLSNVQRNVKNWKEPVSEELIDVAKQYVKEHVIGIDKITFRIATDMFISGAKWKEKKMMRNAIDVTVHIDSGGYPYIPQMELYDYDKDIPLSKAGDKYKVILIKEE